MIVQVDGLDVHANTGGVEPTPGDPLVILIHGAGMDGTVWQLQTRYLAARGLTAVAIDLPGHGESAGEPISDVVELGAWTTRLIEALGFGPACLVGHSLGTFIAMEAAIARPDLVRSLVLMGTATAMPVHPELRRLADDDLPKAAALMAGWGHDEPARKGLNPTPGMWMTGSQRALIERSAPGVLGADFDASAGYDRAEATAAQVAVPTTVILGDGDRMTRTKSGKALAAAIDGAELIVLRGVGHSMMHENARAVRSAIVPMARVGV